MIPFLYDSFLKNDLKKCVFGNFISLTEFVFGGGDFSVGHFIVIGRIVVGIAKESTDISVILAGEVDSHVLFPVESDCKSVSTDLDPDEAASLVKKSDSLTLKGQIYLK